jgi:hypothetical protein
MSLNRYEQALFSYWEKHPDERRHWHTKVIEATRVGAGPGAAARALERELWDHFVERSAQVPALRELAAGGVRRVSLLNLAEHLIRLWGPPPKQKNPGTPRSDSRTVT